MVSIPTPCISSFNLQVILFVFWIRVHRLGLLILLYENLCSWMVPNRLSIKFINLKIKSNLLKKNLVLALSGADTLPSVHGSSNLGFMIGGWENICPPFPEPLNDTLTNAFASLCNSSLVFLLGIYDFLF